MKTIELKILHLLTAITGSDVMYFLLTNRRSTRVQDLTQRQTAQKIMAENLKKEQEELAKLNIKVRRHYLTT